MKVWYILCEFCAVYNIECSLGPIIKRLACIIDSGSFVLSARYWKPLNHWSCRLMKEEQKRLYPTWIETIINIYLLNSFALGWCSSIFKYVIFKHCEVRDIYNSFCEMTSVKCNWASLVTCQHWFSSGNEHQAAKHHLNQYWPNSMTPYADTVPQWVHVALKDLLRAVSQHTWRPVISIWAVFHSE